MSTKYKEADEVPLETIINRLDELSTAMTQGRDRRESEFTMRIPAELDRDADLVLSIAAGRLEKMQEKIESLESYLDEVILST